MSTAFKPEKNPQKFLQIIFRITPINRTSELYLPQPLPLHLGVEKLKSHVSRFGN